MIRRLHWGWALMAGALLAGCCSSKPETSGRDAAVATDGATSRDASTTGGDDAAVATDDAAARDASTTSDASTPTGSALARCQAACAGYRENYCISGLTFIDCREACEASDEDARLNFALCYESIADPSACDDSSCATLLMLTF